MAKTDVQPWKIDIFTLYSKMIKNVLKDFVIISCSFARSARISDITQRNVPNCATIFGHTKKKIMNS